MTMIGYLLIEMDYAQQGWRIRVSRFRALFISLLRESANTLEKWAYERESLLVGQPHSC